MEDIISVWVNIHTRDLYSIPEEDCHISLEEIGVIDLRLLDIFRRVARRTYLYPAVSDDFDKAAIFRNKRYFSEGILFDDIHKGKDFIRRVRKVGLCTT